MSERSHFRKPRGRPPIGAILMDGRWQLTDESLAKAAERLEKHRTDCRERYRRNRAALVRQRPDLFKYKPKSWAMQHTLVPEQDSTETPTRV